jgi:hypothetical protein
MHTRTRLLILFLCLVGLVTPMLIFPWNQTTSYRGASQTCAPHPTRKKNGTANTCIIGLGGKKQDQDTVEELCLEELELLHLNKVI